MKRWSVIIGRATSRDCQLHRHPPRLFTAIQSNVLSEQSRFRACEPKRPTSGAASAVNDGGSGGPRRKASCLFAVRQNTTLTARASHTMEGAKHARLIAFANSATDWFCYRARVLTHLMWGR